MANRFLTILESIHRQIRLNGGKELLTADDAALMLGIKKSYLYKLTSGKQIPHYKPSGNILLFKRPELLEWVEQGRIPTGNELLKNHLKRNR